MAGVTIKDIARAAGVTHPTVSKALNNAPGVREETRRRILTLARQMNYVPNAAAKRLAKGKNRSLGFIWPQVEGLFFYHLCSSLQREALRRDIDVVVSMSEPVKALRTFRDHFIDFTLAWFFPDWTPGADLIKERERYDGEMMILGGGRMEGAHQLPIDRVKAVCDAVAYLSRIGHKRVAYMGELGGKSQGYIQGLLENGLEHHKSRLITVDSRYYDGAGVHREEMTRKFTRLWQSEHRPSALIIDSQDTAFGLIHCLHQLGIVVPRDLSLISYDDIPELSIYQVPLTTCGPAMEDVIGAVLDLYENFFQKLPEGTLCRTISPRLIVRESTRPL